MGPHQSLQHNPLVVDPPAYRVPDLWKIKVGLIWSLKTSLKTTPREKHGLIRQIPVAEIR